MCSRMAEMYSRMILLYSGNSEPSVWPYESSLSQPAASLSANVSSSSDAELWLSSTESSPSCQPLYSRAPPLHSGMFLLCSRSAQICSRDSVEYRSAAQGRVSVNESKASLNGVKRTVADSRVKYPKGIPSIIKIKILAAQNVFYDYK